MAEEASRAAQAEQQPGRWETGVPGLSELRIQGLLVQWEDDPSEEERERRLLRLMAALRAGFEAMEETGD